MGTVRVEMVTPALRVDGVAWGERSAIAVSPILPSCRAGKAEWSTLHTVGAKQVGLLHCRA